jgi:hypothetical protein
MPNKEQDDRAYWKDRCDGRRVRLNSRRPECLPSEDVAAYDALEAEFYADLKPAFPEERSYVDEIVFLVWSLRRLDRTEVELFTYLHQNAYHTHADFPLGQPLVENPKAFNALTWRAISVRKALKEAFAAFYDLRDNPLPPPPPPTPPKQNDLPEIGFEFSTHTPPASAPPDDGAASLDGAKSPGPIDSELSYH